MHTICQSGCFLSLLPVSLVSLLFTSLLNTLCFVSVKNKQQARHWRHISPIACSRCWRRVGSSRRLFDRLLPDSTQSSLSGTLFKHLMIMHHRVKYIGTSKYYHFDVLVPFKQIACVTAIHTVVAVVSVIRTLDAVVLVIQTVDAIVSGTYRRCRRLNHAHRGCGCVLCRSQKPSMWWHRSYTSSKPWSRSFIPSVP